MHRGKFAGFVTRPDSFWRLYTKVGILYENYPDSAIILYSLFFILVHFNFPRYYNL